MFKTGTTSHREELAVGLLELVHVPPPARSFADTITVHLSLLRLQRYTRVNRRTYWRTAVHLTVAAKSLTQVISSTALSQLFLTPRDKPGILTTGEKENPKPDNISGTLPQERQ